MYEYDIKMTDKCTICAFDIGIKNLSYCFLSHDKNDNKRNIKQWELIDLRTSRKKCNFSLKSGEMCQKDATMSHSTNEELFFCNKHATQYKKQLNDELSKSKTESLCNYDNCKKNGNNEFQNKIYCDTHIKKITKQFIYDNKLCKIKVVGCMKEPLYDLGNHLYIELDKRIDILTAQKIVIENQPSMTNPTMKSISILLLSYFILHKHPCVEFIAPSGKLKINETLTKNILSQCKKDSMKYKITKRLGIKYCEELLNSFENNNLWIDKLEESNKKDDLSDAFLHAYYHMFGAIGLTEKKFVDETTKIFNDEILKTKNKNKQKEEDKKKTIKVDV
jgi:hypothetical protein